MDKEETEGVCFSSDGRLKNYLLLLDGEFLHFMGGCGRVAGHLALKHYVPLKNLGARLTNSKTGEVQ